MEGQLINQFMNEKAGMSEVDKKIIAQKIEKLTAGTPKSIHQKQMQEKRSLEVTEMLHKCLCFSFEQKEQIKRQWWKDINQMKKKRVLDRYWAHFDFDMFYIACELLDKPQLKDKPCAVGGKNSVLSTANYQARKYGLRAAMPTFIALELCPHVILFDNHFDKYRHYSGIFRQILSKYDPELESHGLDQAYVDLTNHLHGKTMEEIHEFIKGIRTQIFNATGLTVSCGVGANKMLAKIASEQRKPNDQFVLQNNGKIIENFMGDKKIRKIPGIGPVNEFYLKGLKIQTGNDILENADILTICFSRLSTEFFVQAALGIGSVEHEFRERKSVGKSQTFKTTDDQVFLQERLKDLCQQVSMQLQELGFVTINVVFGYQTNNFQKRDKTFNLLKYTDKQSDLFDATISYLKSNKFKLRLLGVKCSALMKLQEYQKQQLLSYLNNPKKMKQAIQQEKNSVDHIKSLMRNEVVDKGKFMCPICSESVDCKGNVSLFNKHVDRCLSKGQAKSNIQSSSSKVNRSEPDPVRTELTKTKSQKSKGRPKKQKNDTSGTLSTFLKKG